jgi:hypothetical protein
MIVDSIGRQYLTLALNLNRHCEGFVDAYFGPEALKAEMDAKDPPSLETLAGHARDLQKSIDDSESNVQRKDYLSKQVRAMAAIIRNLSGDMLPLDEEVELYLDIVPEMVDEGVFEAFRAKMDSLLPGKGSLAERALAWEKSVELQGDCVLPVCECIIQEARTRARELFDLPPGEEVSLRLVDNQPWQAYSRYLGRCRSQIDLNTDLPLRIEDVVPVLPHETYPGHHAELAIKEELLYRGEGRAEHSLLATGPQAVVSEGLAMWAWEIIFDGTGLVNFLRDEIYPLAGLPAEQVERDLGVMRANVSLLGVVDGNAALLLHRDGWPPDEVQQYLVDFGLLTPDRAAKSVEFMMDPLWRSYTFNYAAGRKLLTPLLQGPDRVANFGRLLSEPFTPTQVREWVAQRESK